MRFYSVAVGTIAMALGAAAACGETQSDRHSSGDHGGAAGEGEGDIVVAGEQNQGGAHQPGGGNAGGKHSEPPTGAGGEHSEPPTGAGGEHSEPPTGAGGEHSEPLAGAGGEFGNGGSSSSGSGANAAGAAGELSASGAGGAGGAGGAADPAPFCGDGARQGLEQCDDANALDGDGCDADCTPTRIQQVVSGEDFSCALFSTGLAKCWGSSFVGCIGNDDFWNNWGDDPGEMGANLPFLNVGTGARVASLVADNRFACALLVGGKVKCWGWNSGSALGAPYGDTTVGNHPGQMGDAMLPVELGASHRATRLGIGEYQACAILEDESLKCWGGNSYGELGLGTTGNRGDNPEQMGDSLPVVNLGTGRVARSVVGGWGHTCALLDNGSVKCWGIEGAIGLGASGDVGDEPGEMGDALPPVNLGTNRTALAIAAGSIHTCAILDDKTVKCWGYNDNGQLGLGDHAPRGLSLTDMGDALPIVDLGTGRTANTIAAADDQTCAILDDASVKCWGLGWYGRLGLGDDHERGGFPGTMGDALPVVSLGTGLHAVALSLGSSHSCALLDNGWLKCWGENRGGSLGLGEKYNNRGDELGEMGDALPNILLW